MLLSDYIVELLEKAEVSHTFGFPSEQMEPYYASLDKAKYSHILCRSEAGAAIMADGYARTSFKAGICDGVGGCGATNLSIGMIEAFGASSPLIVMTGDNSREIRGKEIIQGANNIEILKEFTKNSYDPETAKRAIEALKNAIRETTTGIPSPVHVNLTNDILNKEIEIDIGDIQTTKYPKARPEPNEESVDKTVKILSEAEKPVIISGEGSLRSQAWDSVKKLAEKTHTPVVTSMNGKGIIPETNPHSAGVVGKWGCCQTANDVVEESDAILAIGNKLGQLTTAGWSNIPEEATIIHVNMDSEWLGKNYDVDLPILADIKATIENVVEKIDESDFTDRENRIKEVAESKLEWFETCSHDLESDSVPIEPERVINEIYNVTPDDSILVSSTSNSGWFTSAFYRVREAGVKYIQARGSDGINYCLPQALGAQVANPDTTVVAVSGDGGFGYHISELETAVREELPITVALLNNQALMSSKLSQWVNWDTSVSTDFSPGVDYAQIAEGFGCEAEIIEKPENLESALKNAINSKIPTLLDIRVNPDAIPPVLL